ncbi:MAG: D-glycero-beta-D-manno-heptose-7-phosphate kinase [Candidatus Cloacimonadota bacterium]|nr:MAG: D-glycero-beta-D-manno-heptose-7-phosphate kinase [Candidatus Cloacimonadota bacterium]
MTNLIEQLKNQKILVIGDLMLDEYLWGKVTRISPEAPVPIVEVSKEEIVLGGAANVANNLVALGVSTHIMSIIGDDSNGLQLIDLLKKNNIQTDLIQQSKNRKTTIKTRVGASQQQIVRIDREQTNSVSKVQSELLLENLKKNIKNFDGIILSDYDKGLLSETLLDGIRSLIKDEQIVITVDPKSKSFHKYRGFTCMTPNQLEAEIAIGDSLNDEKTLKIQGEKLRNDLQMKQLIITLGKRGMALFNHLGYTRIDTVAREVFDVTGAGDTVISVLTACLCCSLSLEKSAKIANSAAGLVVAQLGAATINEEELKWIQTQLD